MVTLCSSFSSSLIPVVLILLIGKGAFETVRCPRYCTCYLNTTDYTRSVACIGKRLDNIDLSVPKRVQTLDLSNNSISVIDDRGFQHLGLLELVNLYLKYNSIRTVGLHGFTGLVFLTKVDLSGNNLYQILPWTFHDNSNLKFISLTGNPLGHIKSSGPLLDIPSLEVLELSNCHFGYFSDDAFSALPNLKRLDISLNQLISFDLYTIHFLQNLNELDISENPWQCNANMKSLKDFLESKSGKLKGFSCDLQKEEGTLNRMKPVMFEKIIAVAKDYPEYENIEDFGEEIISAGDKDRDSSEEDDTQNNKKVNCDCKSEDKDISFCKIPSNFPPFWIVFVSFQFGVCTTLISGYCCVYCYHKRKKYQHLDTSIPVNPTLCNSDVQSPIPNLFNAEEQSLQSSVETITCPDTPPPSYRELFVT